MSLGDAIGAKKDIPPVKKSGGGLGGAIGVKTTPTPQEKPKPKPKPKPKVKPKTENELARNNIDPVFAKRFPKVAKTLAFLGDTAEKFKSLPGISAIDRAVQAGGETVTTGDFGPRRDTGSPFLNTAADIVGSIGGFVAAPRLPGTPVNMALQAGQEGVNVLEKLAQKAGPKVAGKLSPEIAKKFPKVAETLKSISGGLPVADTVKGTIKRGLITGPVQGTAYGVAESGATGKPLKETVPSAVAGFTFAEAGVAPIIKGLGQAISKRVATKAAQRELAQTTAQSASTLEKDLPIKPLPPKSQIKLIKPSEIKAKERGFVQTIKESKTTLPQVKKGLKSKANIYEPINNLKTLQEAQKLVGTNIDDAIKIVKAEGPATAKSFATAQVLIQKAQKEGRYQDAIDLVETVAEKATTAGQAVQALSMWSRLTPDGMLKYAQKTLDKANTLRPGLKAKLTPDLAKEITDAMNLVKKLPEGRERTLVIAKILDKIANQIPPTTLQKISSFQTMAQLLNPKTAVRNIIGNLGFATGENISDVVAAGLDVPISKITGIRTKSLPSITNQLKGAKRGFKLGLEDALLGIDTSAIKTQFDLPKTKAFKSGIGKKLETLMNVELRATDRAFYSAAYDESLRQQLKAGNIKVPTEEMKEIAHLDGLYRTFQDENAISKVFVGLKRSLNAGKEFGLGDLVIKYPKTPANLLARGIDYSPVGFVTTVYKLINDTSSKALKQKRFVESASRALVGSTGLVGVGAMLHRLGLITGGKEEDRDISSLKREVGIGEFRINTDGLKRFALSGFDPEAAKLKTDDKLVSYDWFQPAAIGLAMGADIDKNKAGASGFTGSLINAVQSGTTTLAEQPLLQGIKTLANYQDIPKGIAETIKGVPSSFVPTIFSQVRQLVDSQARSTYASGYSAQMINKVKAKLPGIAKSLEPQITTFGEEKKTYNSTGLKKVFDVFLNPAFVKRYNPTPEAQLVLDIYANSGLKNQAPRVLQKQITVKGQRIDLTPQEYTKLQKFVGQEVANKFRRFAESESFNYMPDELKAKRMQDVLTDIGIKGRRIIIEERGGTKNILDQLKESQN